MTLVAALGLLSACAPAIPDSGAGAGFNISSEQQSAPAAALAETSAAAVPPPKVVSEETLAPASPVAKPAVPIVVAAAPAPEPVALPPSVAKATTAATVTATSTVAASSDDIAKETAAALNAAASNSGQAPLQASPSNPAPTQLNSAGISDENDFQAVSERESIQSDADRIARNKAQYQVVAPTTLPSRSDTSQPNIVSYALSTSHQPGTRVYSRTGINMAARAARNCAEFPSPDQAQISFLSNGGPERDRKALDPDGDGYACSWDPSPFRKVVSN